MCEVLKTDGGTLIICRHRGHRKACKVCGKTAGLLCDFPTGRGKTCDAPLCSDCVSKVGGADFCPEHPRKLAL